MGDAKIPIATLIERESANGNRYFSGIMGAARVVLFRDRRDAPDGSPVWMFFVQDSDREPWHPAGPADGKSPRQGAEGARSPVGEPQAPEALAPWTNPRMRASGADMAAGRGNLPAFGLPATCWKPP